MWTKKASLLSKELSPSLEQVYCWLVVRQADTGKAALISERDGELSTALQHTTCSLLSSLQGESESESEQDSSPLERLQIQGSHPETNCLWPKREKTALSKIPIQKPEGITSLDSSPIRDLCPTEHCVMPARKRCVTLQFVGNLQVILSVFHSSVLSKEYLLFFSPPDAFVFTIKVSSFCSVLSPVTKHQTYCQTL